MIWFLLISFFFFFNDTATTEIYTLSLHDALPISASTISLREVIDYRGIQDALGAPARLCHRNSQELLLRNERSEEHTSELQSQSNLVCRLLLEKKKK